MPNFSGSQTFSLTAAAEIGFRFALPAGMLLQSETKFEPDLRLLPTLLDVTCCDLLHTLLYVAACCYVLLGKV